MKTKYLLLIGMALTLLSMPALAAGLKGRTQGGSVTTGTGAFTGPMAGTTGTNYGIEGSAHDFSQEAWISRQDVCGNCHVPHADNATSLIPLWEHANSANSSWQMFTSDQLTTLGVTMPTQPSGVSLACLSCHDGSVAVNQSATGITGTLGAVAITSYNATYQIGANGNLTHVHPISVDYNAAQAVDAGLNPSSSQIPSFIPTQTPGTWNPNATIAQAMLTNGKMECSSCHDVHAQIGNAANGGILLKISGVDAANRGSLLCRTCHIK